MTCINIGDNLTLGVQVFAGVLLVLIGTALTACGLQRGAYAIEAIFDRWRHGWLRLACWCVVGLSGAGLGSGGLIYVLSICASHN